MDGDTRGLGSRVMDGVGRPPRRLFVLGGGAAALALLVDRGVRVDLPQPPPPVPTRRPAPDEDLLLSAVADLTHLVDAETQVLAGPKDDALVRRLRSVNREQLRVLRRLGCELGQGYLFGRPTSEIALQPDLLRAALMRATA